MKQGRIAAIYKSGEADRAGALTRARRAAELTDPTILPPEGYTGTGDLPRSYQSLLARGVMNLKGLMLLALFPPDTPWFQRQLDSRLTFDPRIPAERIENINNALQAQDLILLSKLEATSDSMESRRVVAGFRSRQGQALDQLLVTGDVLQEVTDDFRIRNYRRDRYITKRDSCGDVVYHTIMRCVDVLSLDDKTLDKSGLKRSEFEGKNDRDRMVDMFTHVSWEANVKKWKIEQELNGKTVAEAEDVESRFISTPYKLPLEADYGVGMIELLFGDGESLEELTRRILDFAALATRFIGVLDDNSEMNESDIANIPNGGFLRGEVQNGQVQKLGWLKLDKYADFQVVAKVAESLEKRLGGMMLLESSIQPTGDRVTATQVQRLAREIDGALGGVYAPIADHMQGPLVRRISHLAQKQKLFPPMPTGTVKTEMLTGIAALSREVRAERLISAIAVINQLDPNLLRGIDMATVMSQVLRYLGVFAPGILKTKEQIAQEDRQAMNQQLALAAGEEGIATLGEVARNRLNQGATEQ